MIFLKHPSCFFTIFLADDTSVFLEGKEYTKLVEILNEELNKITVWLNANKLMINVKKRITLPFTSQKLKPLVLMLLCKTHQYSVYNQQHFWELLLIIN